MPFLYPATSIFDEHNTERVVWSQEQYDACLAAGWWSDRRPVATEAPAEPPKRKGRS